MSSSKLLLLKSNCEIVGDSHLGNVFGDLQIITAPNLIEARRVLDAEPVGCVLVAGDPADLDPVDIIESLQLHESRPHVIFWKHDRPASDVIRLARAGADYCFGSGDRVDDMADYLKNLLQQRTRDAERRIQATSGDEPWLSLLVGQSRAMQKVVETIRLIGPRRCTVLIGGETGTGKEMAARALHTASSRSKLPMVAVNCSALPDNLLEAELFGHVKGAFTGAINTRVGRFEQANKSTLFLDEIADMPIQLQAKLLRVLQDREIQRLGSSETIKVDVRVVAASNVNLLERVRQGTFREDLFYRLNVVPLNMPPLRQRTGDVALLTQYFVEKICRLEQIAVKNITPGTLNGLSARQWPGNVRELENTVEMAIAMSGNREMLYPSDFALAAIDYSNPHYDSEERFELPDQVNFAAAVSQFEKSILEQALRKTSGNKTAAAELLGLKRTTLIMKLRSFEGARTAYAH